MNTKDNYRTIHTHLYSKIASEILRSVEGQLSDGMWENSRAMEKYWLFSSIDTARKYSVSQHMKISGMLATESEVKAEVERRERIAEIEQKANDELRDLDREKQDAISKIEAEYAAKRSAVITKMNEQKAAIKAA